MSLADIVASNPTTKARTGSPCSVGSLLDELDGPDRDALLFILYGEERQRGGRGWPQSAIYATLVKEGHVVSQQQINRHRSGQCRCEGDR